MFEAVLIVAIAAYIAFRHWLHHDKRRMLHRERLAAIEKGIELPAVEQEVQRRSWNVQRFLLLAGVSWIFTGIGVFAAFTAIFRSTGDHFGLPPEGIQFIGIIPAGIGIAHLIAYWAGERHDRR